ncbi:MAG: riboflavin synthase [Saprospiraceae bacterium]|nr:riboflavin synthase [Saprospiraceae bacterium]
MFSGIIESIGKIEKIETENTNVHFFVSCKFLDEIHIDQSISHNGVCLTVVEKDKKVYKVTAIKETLIRSNLGLLKTGDHVNLERSVSAEMRMDGHFVQGHVDTTAKCISVKEENGSWYYTFEVRDETSSNLMVNKGSIAVNGVSLTLVEPFGTQFSVAIIPYTFENTNFRFFRPGSIVNIEFDIMGKYVVKYLESIRESFVKN